MSEYAEDVIKHIAGWVEFSIQREIHCENCLKLLHGSKSNCAASELKKIKNRGGLHFAGIDTFHICVTAEKVLRENKEILYSKNIMHRLVTETLKRLPRTILDDGLHLFEQETLCNHQHQLILLILHKYFNARLYHEAVSQEESIERIRMRNNTITIFSGQ